MIELYGMSSPNVRKVAIMLAELDLEYRSLHVPVFNGEPGVTFLGINPLGKVPVLVDYREDGTQEVVFESGAILFYLAEHYGSFLPALGSARYEVMQWLMVQMSSVGPMLGQHNHFLLLGKQAEPYAAARYKGQARRLYQVLEQQLQHRQWLAGEAYSIADIATYPWAKYLAWHGFSREEFPALNAWCNTIAARPAVKRASERFKVDFELADKATLSEVTPEQLDRFFCRDPNMPAMDYYGVKG